MANKVNLLYFTGTGNSKRILEIIKLAFENNGYIASFGAITEKSSVDIADNEFLGIAFPVYAWGVPRKF